MLCSTLVWAEHYFLRPSYEVYIPRVVALPPVSHFSYLCCDSYKRIASYMNHYIDQMGFEITLAEIPRRIVSLVPSQTEFLFDLGLDESLVGITRFCVHPELKARAKTKVGGTKNPDIELIRELKPDLIIGNKEENRQEDIELLKRDFPVWLSDVNTLLDAYHMMRELGRIVGNPTSAEWIADRIERRFTEFSYGMLPPVKPVKVAYLIWRKPWMVAGGGTFIDSILTTAGFTNAFANTPRYPECKAEDFQLAAPDVLLLSTEPYPFSEKHWAEVQTLAPRANIVLVDGELFSWYGSRLLRTPAYLTDLHTSLRK